MTRLTEEQMYQIEGGFKGFYVFAAGMITFLIGIFDGYFRGLKCNN